MIREVLQEAWAHNRIAVVLAVPACIVFLYLLRLLLIVAIVAGTPA